MIELVENPFIESLLILNEVSSDGKISCFGKCKTT